MYTYGCRDVHTRHKHTYICIYMHIYREKWETANICQRISSQLPKSAVTWYPTGRREIKLLLLVFELTVSSRQRVTVKGECGSQRGCQQVLVLFTNPTARAGYDTRSIFKRSLTGLNSEFSFSWTSCLTKAEEPSPSYYLPIAGGRIREFIPFQGYLPESERNSATGVRTRVQVLVLSNLRSPNTGRRGREKPNDRLGPQNGSGDSPPVSANR